MKSYAVLLRITPKSHLCPWYPHWYLNHCLGYWSGCQKLQGTALSDFRYPLGVIKYIPGRYRVTTLLIKMPIFKSYYTEVFKYRTFYFCFIFLRISSRAASFSLSTCLSLLIFSSRMVSSNSGGVTGKISSV